MVRDTPGTTEETIGRTVKGESRERETGGVGGKTRNLCGSGKDGVPERRKTKERRPTGRVGRALHGGGEEFLS